MVLEDNQSMLDLENIQKEIKVTSPIATGVFMCDCTGCETACFEFCSEGFGPTN